MIFRRTLALCGLAALGACASEPSMEGAGRFKGTWIVTDAFPAGAVTDAASAPKGQTVRLMDDRAGDAAGRLCLGPVYSEAPKPSAEVLGVAGRPGLPDTLPTLTVHCGSGVFASYAAMSDGALLTRYGAWVLRLEPGERLAANPAPMVPEPTAAPMQVAPAAEPPPAAAAPEKPAAPVRLVYLASYKTEAWAKKGWSILAARSATLKASQPVMKPVEIKGKGKFIRLFAGAADEAAAKSVCRELGKAVAECGIAGRE